LLDAGKGSGETFDWSFAQEVAQVHDQARSQAQSCMKARAWGLAGGMNARTVKSALAAFTPQFPQLIDVSSGIEGAPSEEGLSCKSPQRMREFLRVVDEEVKRWQA
jgi:phosphoribosylanthranilate isomerase